VEVQAGFLQAICDNPDDDTPRLVFADWLDEHGGPGHAARAELIRVQIELARLLLDHHRRPALAARERALLVAHQAGWRRELPSLSGIIWGGLERGFVAAVWASLPALREHQAAVLAAAPVERLWLGSSVGSAARELAALECLPRVTSLDLHDSVIGPHGLDVLLASTRLTRLRALYLANNNLGVRGARSLADAPRLQGLRELHLPANGITDAGAQALAESTHLKSLAVLDLRRNSISQEAARILALRFPFVQV
jgi:uncharacterized protein (TIGR02996 family)